MYEPGRGNSAVPGPIPGHGQDDTPFTHRGIGDADVVFDVPVPGRVALMQIESAPGEHLRLWRIDRPGGPVGRCVYAGPPEGSDASILTLDERLRAVTAVRVRCAGAWSLQLKHPDAAREFERSVEGFGSEVLWYTGPLGVGRLTGARSDGPVDVRLASPSVGAVAGVWQRIELCSERPWQSGEFQVAGPRMVVVAARGAWSIDVEPTPPIRPDLPAGTFVLHGVGDLAAIVPITRASELSVLEVVWVSGAEFTVECGEYGSRRAYRHRIGPDRQCLRFRLGVELWARGVPVRIVGRGSEWEVRTTSAGGARSGTGLGVGDFDAADAAGFRLLPMRRPLGPEELVADRVPTAEEWLRPVWTPEAEAAAETHGDPQHAPEPAGRKDSRARRLLRRLGFGSRSGGCRRTG
ncbi:hypothetical protein [Embleya scabrispora]|uniref:hypothetical protein n=1 Tax=Embleya scabrispora TaxID=159449 RepID=UPI00037456F8|nr:hypothetical protein [Embleya scabrispora]MYS78793.1 hypothetical protein [Streptomyces sp. SID5474]